MELVRRIHPMKEICRQARAHGRKVGFVPTMGALHHGHVSLVRRARELADVVIVSVFVNPLQFDAPADLEQYPRDLAADANVCVAENVDYLFAPAAAEMYPSGPQTVVEVSGLSQRLEGASRPGHFRGVATVVLKLFQIVQPTIAAFGQKDAQQAAIVRKLVADLMLDVEVLVLPIVREPDGLAASSRNRRLSATDRKAALAIPRALDAARQLVAEGQHAAGRIVQAAHDVLASEPELVVDYVELVDPRELEPVDAATGETLLLIAAVVGGTRLIDNTLLRS